VFAQRRAALRLAQRAATLPWFRRAKTIAFYMPADGEIDPLPLMSLAWRLGKRTFLPSLQRGNRLAFVEFYPNAPLRLNRFGIPEPWRTRSIALHRLDAVCLPLVGFDREGGRLGMGGGFYDRTFAAGRAPQPRLIGLAHALQECDNLPREAWDVPLHGIATDGEWIPVRRGAGRGVRVLSPASHSQLR